jgi:hypothetical protein
MSTKSKDDVSPEVQKLMNMTRHEELKDKYMRLREAYFQLVGNLYPGIVYEQLLDLQREYVQAGGKETLPPVSPPTASGYIR